jgi:transposase
MEFNILNKTKFTDTLTEDFKLFPFLKYYKKNRSIKYIVRCLACHYIQKGESYKKISKIIKYSSQTIGEWVKMYNEGGIDKMLSIREGRGRKARIKQDKKEEFNQFVVQLQKDRDGGRIIGEDIVSMIKEKYNESYSVSGVYKLLKRMDMSWVSARSIHTKSDHEAQEAFKKTF